MYKKIRNYIGIGMVLGCLSGCSDEVPLEGQTATVSFQVATRAAGNPGGGEITADQFVRLYVAERKPESGKPKPSNPAYEDQYNVILYCDTYHDLEGQSYQVTNLPGVWHKFAFVCVPNVTEDMGSKMFPTSEFFMAYKDLYDFTVNYEPVLGYQSDLNRASRSDLAIYRKIIDRWIDADMPTHEDVLMDRITGQLVLNMGKPADQFDTMTKGAVTGFTVSMKTSRNCYIRDEACDSVIVIDRTTKKFTWTVDETKQLEEQVLPIALLPGTLAEATVTVYFENNTTEEYPLQGRVEEEEPDDIVIKKNTRTMVLFNGKEKDRFEVRYAGFADGDDATVDADDDAWDGWK